MIRKKKSSDAKSFWELAKTTSTEVASWPSWKRSLTVETKPSETSEQDPAKTRVGGNDNKTRKRTR